MGLVTRRTRLELAAAGTAVLTVAAIVVVAFGLLHDGRARTAERVTALCAPLSTAITHDPARDMTVRDMLRLRLATQGIADRLGEVIKDSGSELRRPLLSLREGFFVASDRDGTLPIAQRARVLQKIETRAGAFGARCPAPITPAEGAIVDDVLGARRGSEGAAGARDGAGPAGDAGARDGTQATDG